MIYCVVPEALAPELYDKLVAYYEGDPNVKVIIDRRKGGRRGKSGENDEAAEQRELRDRRRRGVPGEFPPVDAAE